MVWSSDEGLYSKCGGEVLMLFSNAIPHSNQKKISSSINNHFGAKVQMYLAYLILFVLYASAF